MIDETSLRISIAVSLQWQILGDILNLETSLPDQLGRSARSEQSEAESLELLGEGQEVRLVVHGQQG